MQTPLMFYREEMPSAETSHFILSYWEFKVDDKISAPVMHEVFPDGCISLFFLRSDFHSFQKLSIAGINLKSVFVPVNPGDRIWGMRILPEACSAFFGIDPLTIKKSDFEPETPGKRFSPELKNKLSECKTFAEAIGVYEKYAKNFGVKNEEIDERLAKATRIFIETEGLAKISETAKEIGLSERQFERNYRKASGLTPKQFARICRFRATAIDMVTNSSQNWAHRAAEKGFADQSHLNREFSNLTGNSPVEFSESVSRIHHEKIIE
jgi:AraC-like DNA-binding protein